MTFEDFKNFQDSLNEQIDIISKTKGKEYAHADSRFANFERLAEKHNVERLLIANIFLTKHLDAIDSYINTGSVSSNEGIMSRFADAILYLQLMAGMAYENEQAKLTDKIVHDANTYGALLG